MIINPFNKDDITMKISFKQKGDFSRTTHYFKNLKKAVNIENLEKYGRMGVSALESATPVDSGVTAGSWYYKIVVDNGKATISFNNSNIQNGVPIAIILQYGHGTCNGGWVEGRDYINPAIRPVFDKLKSDAWKEVTKS